MYLVSKSIYWYNFLKRNLFRICAISYTFTVKLYFQELFLRKRLEIWAKDTYNGAYWSIIFNSNVQLFRSVEMYYDTCINWNSMKQIQCICIFLYNAFVFFYPSFIAWRYVYNTTFSEKSMREAMHRAWSQFEGEKRVSPKRKKDWDQNTKILITIILEQWDYERFLFSSLPFFYLPNFNKIHMTFTIRI